MGVLTDKVVLVTGVGRGCGRVLAEAFSAEGAKVVGCVTDVDGGRRRLRFALPGQPGRQARAADVRLPDWTDGQARGARCRGAIPLLKRRPLCDRLHAHPRRWVPRNSVRCYSVARPAASRSLRPRLASVRGASRRKSRPSSAEAV
jgi:NAD(P)-dependent dehydrogenase (short-subunit alcohol dehydrogenase family)